MTTFRTIASTETDPQAPVTSALMKALEGNTLAIAEGDATAPRVMPAAMAGFSGAAESTHSGTTPVVVSFAFAHNFLRIDYSCTKPGTGAGTVPLFRVRASSDGGATWGAYSTMISMGSASTEFQVTGVLFFNTITGVFVNYFTTSNPSIGRSSGTLAVLADLDALEFSFSTTTGSPVGYLLPAYMGHGT